MSCTYVYQNKQYSKERLMKVLMEESSNRVVTHEVTTWLKDKLGMDENEITLIKGLIDNKSLGRFMEDGKILLSEFADNLTEYHEGFHRVWRMYLTKTERQGYIDQFKQRKNWKKLIEPLREYYPDLTNDELVEEYLADEFGDFVNFDGNIKIEKPIKNIFQKIYDFIKSLIGKSPKDIADLYSDIQKGVFKNKTKIEGNYGSADKVNIGGLDIELETKNEVVDVATNQMLKAIVSAGVLDDFIKGRFVISNDEFEYVISTMVNDLIQSHPDLANAIAEDFMSNNSIIKSDIIKKLNTLNINLKERKIEDDKQVIDVSNQSDEEVDNDVEQSSRNDDGQVNENGEYVSNLEIDPQTNMSKQIKLLLGSLSDNTKTTPLGFPQPVMWSKAYIDLASSLSGIPTKEMVKELSKLNYPYISQIMEVVNNVSSLKNFKFRNDLLRTFATTINNFSIGQIGNNGEFYFFDGDRNTREMRLISDWKDNMVIQIKKDGEVDWKKRVDSLKRNTTAENRKEWFSDVKKILGISVDESLQTIPTENIIRNIIVQIGKTSNIDIVKPFKSLNIEGTINKLSAQQSLFEDNTNAMVSMLGKTMYSFGLPTNMSQVVNGVNYAIDQFTPEMTLGQKLKILKEYVPHLVSEFTMNINEKNGIDKVTSLWLRKILNGDKLKIHIIHHVKNNFGDAEEVEKLDEPDLFMTQLNAALHGVFFTMKHSDRSTFYGLGFENQSLNYNKQEEGITDVSDVLDYLTMYFEDVIQKEIRIAQEFAKNPQAFQNFGKSFDKSGLSEILGKDTLQNLLDDPNLKIDTNLLKSKLTDAFNDYKAQMYNWGLTETMLASGGLNKEFVNSYGTADYAIVNAFANQLIAHVEQTILLSQDLRFYGTPVNAFKRLATLSSTGNLLVTDKVTEDRIIEENAKTTFELYNPKTGKMEDVKQYPLAPSGFVRAVTIKENEQYVSSLTGLATTIDDEGNEIPLLSKLTGKQENAMFMVNEWNMIQDSGKSVDELSDKEKKDMVKVINSYVKKYEGINENDGLSYMNIFSFKNYQMRLGKWTPGMEKIFQVEIQILSAKTNEDLKNITVKLSDGTEIKVFDDFSNFRERELEDGSIVDIEPFHTLKTQYSGYSVSEQYYNLMKQQNSNMKFWSTTVGKDSKHILMPSQIIGTNLQTMNVSMIKNGLDIIHMGSANKVGGIDSKLAAQNFKKQNKEHNRKHIDEISNIGLEFYDKDGHFNSDAIDENHDILSYLMDVNYLKDQVKIGNQVKDEVISSTQSLKLLVGNLIINGKERFPGALSLFRRYRTLVHKLVEMKRDEILDELNYDDNYHQFASMDLLKKFLMNTEQVKSSPENIINLVEQFINDKMFETLPNRNKLENVFYALFHNNAIRIKKAGTSLPQASSTGYEKVGSRQILGADKDGRIAVSNDDTLKFYEPIFDREGNLIKINPAEIIMPLPDYWIPKVMEMSKKTNLVDALEWLNKNIANGKVDNEVTFKGLRIPNQQLSSNDILKVKRFTLPTSQNHVIVPTEFIVKNGSDYDVDKLNLYFGHTFDTKFGDKKDWKVLQQSNIEEGILQLEKEILLHPRNAQHLFMPVTDTIFASAENGSGSAYNEVYMKQLGNKAKEDTTWFDSILPQKNVEKSITFVKGKFGVGIVALHVVGHAVSQVDGTILKQTLIIPIGEDHPINMMGYKDEDLNVILEVLSQLLTTQVDNVKNPTAVLLGITPQTLNVVTYMIRRGYSPLTIVRFIKQPIIQEYLKQQKINESLGNKSFGKELYKQDLINKVKALYQTKEKIYPDVITEEMLNEGLTTKVIDNQIRILDVFLNVVDQSKEFSKFVKDQQVDTAKIKDRASMERFKQNREDVMATETIENYHEINRIGLLSQFNTSKNVLDKMMNRFYLMNQELIKNTLEPFKQVIAKLQKNNETKEKFTKRLDEDFITFLVQNFGLENNKFEQLFGLDKQKSLAQQIKELKNNPLYENNLLIKGFFPIISSTIHGTTGKSIDNLRLFERQLTVYDTNEYIRAAKELNELNPQLYKDIIDFIFYQTGMINSPFNYTKIIPFENDDKELNYMSEVIKDSVNKFNELNDIEKEHLLNEFSDLFLKNNSEFLRKKSYPKYPLNYIKTYNKETKKTGLYNIKTKQAEPELGNTYYRDYRLNSNKSLLQNQHKEVTEETEQNEPQVKNNSSEPQEMSPEEAFQYRMFANNSGLQLDNNTEESNINPLLTELYKHQIEYDKVYKANELSKFTPEGYYRYMIEELSKMNPDLVAEFFSSSEAVLENLKADARINGQGTEELNNVYGNIRGAYQNGLESIYYSNTAQQSTLLHELIHGTLQKEYEKQTEFYNKVNDLYKKANKAFYDIQSNEKLDVYGFTSPTEFLAEALSNPEFMRILNDIPYTSENKTLWTKLMELLSDTLLKLIGVNVDHSSVLGEIVRETEKIIENNKEELNKKNESNSLFTTIKDNFNELFPDESYLTEEEKEAMANLIEQGQEEITCKVNFNTQTTTKTKFGR